MNDEKFKAIDKYLINFPKKEIELKQEIKKRGWELLFDVNEANVTSNYSKRLELIESSIALIKQLDFLINICAEKQIINYKKYYKFGEKLEQIIRYLVAWLNSTKKVIG